MRAELDGVQQRDDGEVLLPEEADLHGVIDDEKAAQTATDDGRGELEGEAPGSGEVVLPDKVEEPRLHDASEEEAEDVPVELEGEAPGSGEVVLTDVEVEETAEEVVRPATEEVEMEAGGSGKETTCQEKHKFKSLEAVHESLEDQVGESTDAPHAEEELPDDAFAGEVIVDHNVVHPEEVVYLGGRLAAARAANLLNPETVDELNKLFKEMGLSAADSSGSETKSGQMPVASAGRGRGKKQKEKGNVPAAAGAGRAAKPIMAAAAASGKPDAEHAQDRRSGRGRLIRPNTRYSSDEIAVHGDGAVAWKGLGRR
ncbi:hypothetical protein ZWY2020_023696 [Hordeum vulgare]|nr:hypothetical protein ZWY2020_023696 [Hordeum vulgare]